MAEVFGFNKEDAFALVLGLNQGDSVYKIGGGSSGAATLYRFETTAAYTTGTSVTATIKTMAGTTFASGATLKDPEAIFIGLASGAKGYCIAQGGEYFAIQALCAAEEGYV